MEPGETKNDQARIIPLRTEELYQMLVMQRALRNERFPDCPWVFFAMESPSRPSAAHGMPPRRRPVCGMQQRRRPTKIFHDCRRTGVRNLIRAGVPEKIAMLISGHKTRSVFER